MNKYLRIHRCSGQTLTFNSISSRSAPSTIQPPAKVVPIMSIHFYILSRKQELQHHKSILLELFHDLLQNKITFRGTMRYPSRATTPTILFIMHPAHVHNQHRNLVPAIPAGMHTVCQCEHNPKPVIREPWP